MNNGLEELCSSDDRQFKKRYNDETGKRVKDYFVDTSAAWIFYPPVLALSEYFIAGMEPEEVVRSRLFALGVHALVMRPYGKFRQWWADYWHADGDSSKAKKFLVDTTASALYQLPIYSGILAFSGASLEEAAVALPSGLAIGVTLGRPYGYWLDAWRKMWGRKSTLESAK